MYITTHVSTLFPLTATRPNGFKVRGHKTEHAEIERIAAIPVIAEPLYATEAAVTLAIADGTFKGFATTAYAAAKRYQAYLKSIEKPRFFRKASKLTPPSSTIVVPGYAAKN